MMIKMYLKLKSSTSGEKHIALIICILYNMIYQSGETLMTKIFSYLNWKEKINGKQLCARFLSSSLIFLLFFSISMLIHTHYVSCFNDCITEKEELFPDPTIQNNNIYSFYKTKIKYNYYNVYRNEKLYKACFFEPDIHFQWSVFQIITGLTGLVFILYLYSVGCFMFQYRRNKQEITLIYEDRLIKKCSIGFSFKTLLFGFFVPLARADFKWFFVILIFDLTLIGFVSHIVFAFKYNKFYIRECLEKGYKPYDETTIETLHRIGICYQNKKNEKCYEKLF